LSELFLTIFIKFTNDIVMICEFCKNSTREYNSFLREERKQFQAQDVFIDKLPRIY